MNNISDYIILRVNIWGSHRCVCEFASFQFLFVSWIVCLSYSFVIWLGNYHFVVIILIWLLTKKIYSLIWSIFFKFIILLFCLLFFIVTTNLVSVSLIKIELVLATVDFVRLCLESSQRNHEGLFFCEFLLVIPVWN